jgi:hypothetical protein
MTEQRGKIIVKGLTAAKFWVRALCLTADIEMAKAMIDDKVKRERKWGMVPVVAEYELSADFKFVYVLVLEVDQLGLRDGFGAVYFASPKHLAEVTKARNSLAEPILEGLETGRFDEVVELPMKKEL